MKTPILMVVMRIAAALVVCTCLACCGGGADRSESGPLPARTTSSVPATRESTTGQTSEGIPRVARNTPVIYLATSASSSEYLPEYDITLESGKQSVIRLLPASGEMALVEWNLTADWARSSIRPYTVDGRLFIIRHTGLEHNDSHEFTEFDPMTNSRVLYFLVSDPIRWGCVAILGDGYYYQSHSTYEALYGGHLDGEFKHLRFADGMTAEGVILLEADDLERCQGHLQASAGVLYDAQQEAGQIEFYRRDLATGRIAEALGGVTLQNSDQYDSEMEIAFDDGMAYVLTRRLADNQISIYSYAFKDEPQPVYAGTDPRLDEPDYFDVDERYVAVGDGDGYVLFLDLDAGTQRLHEVGFEFYEVQMLYTGER